MARLQILELPEGAGDERPPFILVIDEWTSPFHGLPNEWAQKIGAQGVLVFEDTIDIPANEVPLDSDGHPVKIRVEPDFEQLREQVQAEVRKATDDAYIAVRRAIKRATQNPEATDG
ncbi:hypothetical protein [Streptomyces sp. f150]|uniref:hypothetical protein n=1 Tax=Streptomyces sp. f150 TaxID=1827699 RepID=UPI000BEF994F|nr:hypothetical protein [Streptomyces sp. f150]